VSKGAERKIGVFSWREKNREKSSLNRIMTASRWERRKKIRARCRNDGRFPQPTLEKDVQKRGGETRNRDDVVM